MDLLDLLDQFNIEYWTSGKNVSNGWVNVTCPFCDDQSNHCGIHMDNLKVSCWICGKHNFFNLIYTLTGIEYIEAKNLHLTLSSRAGDNINPPLNAGIGSANFVTLPPECTKSFPKIHKDYLKSRGFPPFKTIRKYKLRAVHTIGKYKFRIIIPIYMNGQLVSFTSRDITDNQDPPYQHLEIIKSIISPKNAIYNYDTIAKNTDAIMVEGPIDVWKMGDGAIGTFGVELTQKQLIFIKRKKIRRLFLFLDPDKAGKKAAKHLSNIIAPLVKVLEIVTLQGVEDPGNLTLAEAESIKYDLGFNA